MLHKGAVFFMLLVSCVFSAQELEYHTDLASCALESVRPIYSVITREHITFDESTPKGDVTISLLRGGANANNRQEFITVGLQFMRELRLLSHQYTHLKADSQYKDLGSSKAAIAEGLAQESLRIGACTKGPSEKLTALHIQKAESWEKDALARIEYLDTMKYPTGNMKNQLLGLKTARIQFSQGTIGRPEFREIKKRSWILFSISDMESLLSKARVTHDVLDSRLLALRSEIESEEQIDIIYYQAELAGLRENVMEVVSQ